MALAPFLQGQDLLTGHTDIKFTYDTGSGQWAAVYNHGGTVENPNTETPLDQASLPAKDLLFPNGDRYQNLPAGFEFTGVPSGGTLWILPQTSRGYTDPGFRTSHPGLPFRYVDPADSRYGFTDPWVKISLKEVIYRGQATAAPEFSLWQANSNGSALVWMSTADGIDAQDVLYLKQNDHKHTNIGFSALGIYRVGYQAEAILDSTGETVTSSTAYVTYAIGTLATWLADHYGGLDLMDDNVTGMNSDSDKDRVSLIEEYAFNMNPVVQDRHILGKDAGTSGLPVGWVAESQGVQRLHLQFVRRRTDTHSQIQYVVEFNDTPADTGWESSLSHQSTILDGQWERVTVVDSESLLTKAQRFARVRIVVQESIAY